MIFVCVLKAECVDDRMRRGEELYMMGGLPKKHRRNGSSNLGRPLSQAVLEGFEVRGSRGRMTSVGG